MPTPIFIICSKLQSLLLLSLCLLSLNPIQAQPDEDIAGPPPFKFTVPDSLYTPTEIDTIFNDQPRGNSGIRLAFYNVENLFDPFDDPITKDDEFTPSGLKGWSERKYNLKRHNIYKVLVGVGGWEAPAIIGLCEIENRFVLDDLVDNTPLKKFDYQIVHRESPDRRGIDVGLLYRPEKVNILSEKFYTVQFPFDTTSTTREILYIKAKILKKNDIHVFVNHWPSRWGGHLATDPKREYVASTVRSIVDSIYAAEPNANIIVTGDLNDAPSDESVLNVLNAKPSTENLDSTDLYNMMYPMIKNWMVGTHKHQEHWGVLDQFVVSAPLINRTNGLTIKDQKANIFRPDWLMEKEEVRLGEKPFRTYLGARYYGGFSDHLPIYIDLIYTNKED